MAHEQYVARFVQSNKVVAFMAGILEGRGHKVRILPATISPTLEERWKHVDSGDLEVSFSEAYRHFHAVPDAMRVEIKQWPGIDFRTLEDVPYSQIIVDEAYKIDRAAGKLPLHSYVIVNASMSAAMVITAGTRTHWFRQTKFDKQQGRDAEFYFCPKGRVVFWDLAVRT